MQAYEQKFMSSNPASVRASSFMQSLTQPHKASYIDIERQISVLKTAKEKAHTKKRKIKSTLKAKHIELESTEHEIDMINQKIEALKTMQEPPDSDEEVSLR